MTPDERTPEIVLYPRVVPMRRLRVWWRPNRRRPWVKSYVTRAGWHWWNE